MLQQFFVAHALGRSILQSPVPAGVTVKAYVKDLPQAAHTFEEAVALAPIIDISVPVANEKHLDICRSDQCTQLRPFQARVEQNRHRANAVQRKYAEDRIRLRFAENAHMGALADTQ